MTYQPLARKYRPMTFSDLVGQETVSSSLSNAIRLGREPHGVIFSGVRGIGKTTTARLYAKALNCTVGVAGEPCGNCENCDAIARGCHEDVFEIDGASNNGVDEIRSLRDTVNYVPQRGKYRVYIIDEVHMLSSSAFNALLKTLEEPPSHVVFILATTEIHKLPDTISSRCLTFHLQKMKPKVIVDRIANILTQEHIKYDEKALWLVAREGQGSMRDALTFLDQVIALGDGQVTLAVMKDMISGASIGPYIELLSKCLNREGKSVLEKIAEFDSLGIQAKSYIGELATLSRHALIVRTLGTENPEIQSLGLDDGELGRLSDIGCGARDFDLNRLFRTLIKCLEDLDGSEMDRYISENYLLEWCFDPGLPSVEDLRKGHFLSHSQSAQKTIPQRTEAPALQKSGVSSAVSSSKTTDLNPPSIKPEASKTIVAEKGFEQPVPSKAKLNVKNFAQGMREALAEPLSKFGQEAEKKPLQGQTAAAAVQESANPIAGHELDKKKSNFSEGLSPQQSLESHEFHQNVSKAVQPQNVKPTLEEPGNDACLGELSSLSEQSTHDKVIANDGNISSGLRALESKFPESWTQLVDIWKITRPLEARKLEEVIPLNYTESQIRLGVKVDSLVGKALLQNDGTQKLKQDFCDLFSFKGELLVDILTDESGGESLLKVKERQAIERKEKLKNEALESPFVKHLSSAFGVQILGVRVSEPGT
ncbi:MAG: DNA polymerase III subunit gamma/tau [Pseudomonadota bacterium]